MKHKFYLTENNSKFLKEIMIYYIRFNKEISVIKLQNGAMAYSPEMCDLLAHLGMLRNLKLKMEWVFA